MHRGPKRVLAMTLMSLLCMLSMLLTACAPSGTSTTPSTTANDKPVKGGTWVDDLYEDVSSLIPNGSVETYSYLMDQSIWAPLFLGNDHGAITPGLATEVPTVANGDISADLKTVTFKLKPNLKWSDGQPLTAKDVDFTWRLWDNPAFGAASTSGFNLIQSADVSHDDLWITFHLKQAYEPFVANWTDGAEAPLPAHIFSKMNAGDVLKSSENLYPKVSSGPFTVTESKPGTEYTVSRNPNYYQAAQGLPYLDKIVFRIVDNQDTILKDAQAGTIDSSWFLDVTKTSTYQKLTNYSIAKSPVAANFEAIYFNLKNPVLQDVNIRKAISMGIDQQQLINVARHGQATSLCTDHPSAFNPGYQADAPCPKYDPAGAKQILQQAGYTLGPDNVFAKDGKKLVFNYSTTSNNAWRAEDEDILQQEMGAIGIKLNITNYPASTFFGTFLPQGVVGKYDLAEFEDTFTYDADDSSLESCSQVPTAANSYGGQNFSFYCNKDLDNLFVKEQTAGSPEERQQDFNQIHQIYLTEYPFVTLYAPVDIAVHKNTTHNYQIGAEGSSETVNVMNWWCTNGTC